MNIAIPLLALFLISDVQIDQNRAEPLAAASAIAAHIGAEVVFDAGDVSEHAWTSEYESYASLFPFAIPVPGNHDWYQIGLWPYGHVVDLVVDGIHVVGFDSGYRTDPAQMAWLAATLDDGPMPTLLFMHMPMYSANDRVGAVAELNRAAFEPMIEAAGVALVVSGHGHAYERHLANGRTYLVAGTGGADLDEVGAAPTLVVSYSAHGWLEVNRDGGRLLVAFRGSDGTILDQFSTEATTGVQATDGMTWGQVKALYGR